MASQFSFTGFAWKNLWRRRLRTLLTLVGIGMAIGAFVALVGFSRAFEHEWLRMYASSGTILPWSRTTSSTPPWMSPLGAKIQALSPIVAAG